MRRIQFRWDGENYEPLRNKMLCLKKMMLVSPRAGKEGGVTYRGKLLIRREADIASSSRGHATTVVVIIVG